MSEAASRGSERTTLIRGGAVVVGQAVDCRDVLIRGERIAALGGPGDMGDLRADRIVDASGLLVLPGAVDTHVHLNDVFMQTISVHDYYTGTRAAAFGGVTSIVDFSNQVHGEPLLDTIRVKHEEAEGKSLIDWGVHPVIVDPTPETLDEIPVVVRKGSPTIKCYMTYRDEGLLIEGDDLLRISTRLRNAGGMLLLHAEDNDLAEAGIARELAAGRTAAIHHAHSKPGEVESTAVRAAIDLTRATGGRTFVVHLTTREAMEMIAAARTAGTDIHTETCTHYLVFTDDHLRRADGLKWICSPPLRDAVNQEHLWRGVADGRLGMVTSDDAAYSWEAKLYGADRFDKCPNGLPGIETRLNVLYSEGVAKGRLSLPRFVEIVAEAPARIFGLWPQKGSLLPGADADVVLFDPDETWLMGQDTLHMSTDWSVFDDVETTGKIVAVFSRGEQIIDGDQCTAEAGRGRYLHRELPSTVTASVAL